MLNIEHVLINLVDNGMKYAPDSKEIIINAERLNDKIKISVTDYGRYTARKNTTAFRQVLPGERMLIKLPA